LAKLHAELVWLVILLMPLAYLSVKLAVLGVSLMLTALPLAALAESGLL
jgi:hypothetical protein